MWTYRRSIDRLEYLRKNFQPLSDSSEYYEKKHKMGRATTNREMGDIQMKKGHLELKMRLQREFSILSPKAEAKSYVKVKSAPHQ